MNCPNQCGHIDVEQSKNTEPGFFIIVPGAKILDLWVSYSSYKTLDMRTDEKRLIEILMKLKVITFSTQSVFVAHEITQHAGRDWSGTPSIPCRMYLIPQSCEMMGTGSFSYSWCFGRLVNRCKRCRTFSRSYCCYCIAIFKQDTFARRN